MSKGKIDSLLTDCLIYQLINKLKWAPWAWLTEDVVINIDISNRTAVSQGSCIAINSTTVTPDRIIRVKLAVREHRQGSEIGLTWLLFFLLLMMT